MTVIMSMTQHKPGFWSVCKIQSVYCSQLNTIHMDFVLLGSFWPLSNICQAALVTSLRVSLGLQVVTAKMESLMSVPDSCLNLTQRKLTSTETW